MQGSFKCGCLPTHCTDINESYVTEHVIAGNILFNVNRNNQRKVKEVKNKVAAVVENISRKTLIGAMEHFSQNCS
jgi:hypothetical protein